MARDEQRRSERLGFQPHNATRLARVIVGVLRSDADIRTIAQLCRQSDRGVSPGTLRGWCRAEGIKASCLLDLTRVLRLIRFRGRFDYAA